MKQRPLAESFGGVYEQNSAQPHTALYALYGQKSLHDGPGVRAPQLPSRDTQKLKHTQEPFLPPDCVSIGKKETFSMS